jgi:rod shape determining protein RodA
MFESYLNESQTRVDRLQLAVIAMLMMVGAAFVFSATRNAEAARIVAWFDQTWVRQVIWYLLGAGVATGICLVEYHTLTRWAYIGYWLTILLLLALLIPGIGVTRYGATRWIDLKFFLMQPSEFAKISFILAMANFLSRPVDELKNLVTFGKGLGMMALPFVLIMKEPDLGSAIVLLPTGFVMMFVAGVPRKYLIRLMSAGFALGTLFLVDVLFAPPGWWTIKLEDYQRHRLLVFFGRDFARADATPVERAAAHRLQEQRSHQVRQALITVGSGGLLGKGWCEGNQTALGFLPSAAAHNDFVFSVIAEEKGFVGSLGVLTLYAVLLFTGLRTAGQARDRLGKLVAAGVVTLLFSHVFINIGMNIRLMPVTGIPLPLISYGGSSVICSLIAIGLLQNIHIYRKGY